MYSIVYIFVDVIGVTGPMSLWGGNEVAVLPMVGWLQMEYFMNLNNVLGKE